MPVNTEKRTELDINRMWERSRAVVNGEAAVKKLDAVLDTVNFTNILVPFSSKMKQNQYNFYRAEAELPGLVGQYVKIIVGGLLRKPPTVEINDPKASQRVTGEPVPENDEMLESINKHLLSQNNGLLAFILKILDEELTTSRSVVSIAVREDPTMSRGVKAYPVLWKAEEVINWQTNEEVNTRVVFKYTVDEAEGDKYDLKTITYYEDHFMNEDGYYQIDKFRESVKNIRRTPSTGRPFKPSDDNDDGLSTPIDTIIPMVDGKPFEYLPVWFINGNVDPIVPMLTPMVDKELVLYNKLSRRNHLMYNACTYTPVLFTNMDDQQFNNIVNRGLGTWVKMNQDDKVDTFEAPTEALGDIDKAIKGNIDELGRMGIRLLTPEANSGVSGIALEIRNSPQTAQLGLLNTRISDSMTEIIQTILYWNYGEKFDIVLQMSEDFNPAPLGDQWLRLVTEWYESGHIPRSLWLQIARDNDIIPETYDDKVGQEELRNQVPVRGIALPAVDLETEEERARMMARVQNQNGPPNSNSGGDS